MDYANSLKYNLDENYPLWEILVIHNFNENQTVLIPRIDHIYGDGMIMFYNLLNIHDDFEGVKTTIGHITFKHKIMAIRNFFKAVGAFTKRMAEIPPQNYAFREVYTTQNPRQLYFTVRDIELFPLKQVAKDLKKINRSEIPNPPSPEGFKKQKV